METLIYTKAQFLDALQNQIKDDEVIVATITLEGAITVNKKRNLKKVTFGFAADAFRLKDDVRHFAYGETPLLAFALAKKEHLSEISNGIIEQKKIKVPQHNVDGQSEQFYLCPACKQNTGKSYLLSSLPTICQNCDHAWNRA